MLTHYPGHSDQVFLLDLPQSHQALVRDWRCYGLEQQKSEDHDIFHRGCKAEHTQQHGWLCFPDFQPNILLLQSWVYVKQTPVDKQKQRIKNLRINALSDHYIGAVNPTRLQSNYCLYSRTPLFRSPKGNGKKFEIAGFRNNRGSVKGKGKSKGIRSSFEIAGTSN